MRAYVRLEDQLTFTSEAGDDQKGRGRLGLRVPRR
jgi:hypothetical protein